MQWQAIEDFRQAPNEESGVRKAYAAEVKADAAAREVTFKISTAAVDRVGDSIAVDGWELDNFLKNPVVLWAHDYTSLPVAKATRVWSDSGALHATAEFTPAGLVRFNDIVFDLYKGGWLNAVSVGFRPKKWAFTEDKDRKFGIDFAQQELLEFSAVPVPANPEALVEARGAGMDVSDLRAWAVQVLKHTPRPANVREFEDFLRESGFSKKDATIIASRGFCLRSESEADAAPTQQETSTADIVHKLRLEAVKAALRLP